MPSKESTIDLVFTTDQSFINHDIPKRIFDIFFSLLVLTLSIPLFLIIALSVRLTSPGPIFYCSLRIGRSGHLFRFWKFRSMYRDADERLEELLNSNPTLKQEWNKYCKLKKDPRLTPIGRFLRRTSLDEFPQFWNVLIGDLSIVGPRPYLPREAQKMYEVIGNQIATLYSLRPGLTGLWQTSGRSLLTFDQRIKLDLKYIQEQNFMCDLRLILKTIPAIFFPNGAF